MVGFKIEARDGDIVGDKPEIGRQAQADIRGGLIEQCFQQGLHEAAVGYDGHAVISLAMLFEQEFPEAAGA